MKKIAIVHDYLNQFGGAERVVEALHEIFPNAPIYTSIYDSKRMPERFREMDIRVSFMQRLPFVMENFRYYFALYPKAFEGFDLSEYDLIISSSSAYAKGIKKRKDALHVCYCHNPMRFVWRYDDYIKGESTPPFARKILPLFLRRLKKWDINSNKNIDCFIANSNVVSGRIKDFYQRDSKVINPPIEVDRFTCSDKDGDYYLIVSRLSFYKRIDLAVAAFSRLGLPLKIVGSGPAEESLRQSAAINVDFLGKVDDNSLRKLYSECKALVFTEEADFGMVPLEAAASGRPSIAYAKGGSRETIIDGETGLFFEEQTVESLVDAVKRFEGMKFNRELIRKHAEKFDQVEFKGRFLGFLNEIKAL